MSSIEALWTVEFQDVAGWINGGVAVFESGRVFGGDSSYYYLGTYKLDRDALSGHARIVHYSGPTSTAFGDNATDFQILIHARRKGDDVIVGEMWKPEKPNLRRPLRFQRRASLP